MSKEKGYKLVLKGYRFDEDFIKLKVKFQKNPPICDLILRTSEEIIPTSAELYKDGNIISTWFGVINKKAIDTLILKTNYERVV